MTHSRRDAQRRIVLGSSVITVVASPDQTGGRYSLYLIEMTPRGHGAAPHLHHRFTESFTVLTGTVTLYDGARWSGASAGDHLVVPERVVHGFRNDTDAPATLLMMSTPGARREDYFDDLVEIMTERRELSPEQWTALFARHDQVMVPDTPS
jgi:mannose-6-phosphate isomerase-like protein (cupin superfamily)